MKFIVGIDEAGRGPLAGPVSVGLVVFPKILRHRVSKDFGELVVSESRFKDSKKLSQKRREEILTKIKKLEKKSDFRYVVSFGSVEEIDEQGITRAIALAMARGLKKLKLDYKNAEIYLDGSLRAPQEFKNQKTIIKGDEKELVISLASIVAKVSRDKLMVQLSKKYDKYDLEIHKGYGTENHRALILKHGTCEIHRKSFCKNI